MPDLSVVVPCYNEQESLPLFLSEIVPVLDDLTANNWELIFVDDGSLDDTWDIIQAASRRDGRVRGVSLSRNFGQQPAIDVGLAFSGGNVVAICDCDLQDPPAVLADLVRRVRDGTCDVCYAVRRTRDAPLPLRIMYRLFYRVMRISAENLWPLDAGDFSAFNRRAFTAILSMPESIRMLRGLRSWVGLKQDYLSYDRPARASGRSKYNLFRLTTLAVRAFVGFSQAPLRLASFIGFGMALASLLLGALVVANRLLPRITPFGYYVGANPGTATIVVLILLVSGALFLCVGIIGEYLAVILREIKRRPAAVVSALSGNPRLQQHGFPLILLPQPEEQE
jgi:glycosyltransferase involved in cell wall biosynthesis